MRKFLAAILSVLCLTCFCLALTACVGPKYYILTYDAIGGVTLDFGEIENGAQVKSGYEVKFTCSVDETRVTGDPTVLINGEDEYPDLDGVYSFIMSRDTEVTVSGVFAINVFDVTFDKEEWRLSYIDAETGNELTSLEDVATGTRVEFTLDISVYYDLNSKFDVLANTTVVNPDPNGVYSFTVTRNTTVKVTGLELEEPFLNREDGGKGTATDPFIIERPIDLYVMADYVNSPFYVGRYGMAYYKLNADIDMEGEQLFIIGDSTTSTAVFCGDFDGNNHKIYNYYISDTIVEQSEFSTVFLPYIGLFGMAAATNVGPAKIYDLTLENFTINVNADRFNTTFAAGGLVGAGIGVEITNCNVSGSITADADDVYYGYMGGVVGFLQSAYNSASERALASVAGCSSNVSLEGQFGYLYAAGGIAGYVYSYEESTPAYIVNSYSVGSVSGAINAGGIAGYMSPYSSIKNCYSLGTVDAYNSITPTPGFTEHAYAYAGGIAGYVERESIISGCFSLASVYASAYNSQYARSGKICGGLSEGGGENIECAPALVFNCTDSASNVNEAYLTGTLGWKASDWSFDGEYPVYVGVNGNKSASVTVNRVTNGSLAGSEVINLSADAYLPLAEWYNSDMPEFITLANGASGEAWRSYGYYFDKDLTQRVPRGYVPSGNETLYYSLADYALVSGVYYLQTAQRGSGIYIELKSDGTLIYRNGAINLTTSYIFDGTALTLFDSPAFIETLTNSDGSETTYYSCGIGTLSNGVLRLVNNLTYTESSPLVAVKEIEGFLYGGYYSANNTECIFYTDGTAMLNGAPATYTVNGNTVTINGQSGVINAVNRTVTIGGTVYTAYDPFKGTWEKSATTHIEFTFNGINAWTYEYYGYIDGVKNVLQRDSGTYTFDGTDTLTLSGGSIISNGTKVSMDENGFIKLTSTDLTYYKQFSAVGTWRYFYKDEAIEITFNGIGSDGYGTASISYETVSEDLEVTYHVQNVVGTDYIYLFLEDTVLGILHYDVNDFTLRGMIYSYAEDEMLGTYYVYGDSIDANGSLEIVATYEDVVAFCLYDDFGGQWMSVEWGLVEFNGYGSYNLSSVIIREERNKILTLPVSGTVTIGQKTGTYKLDDATMMGKLVYDGATYNIEYNQSNDTITVNGGMPFTLYRPDRMMGIQLKASDGTVYTFDGGSALPGGGNVTAVKGAASNSYKYTMNGTAISITGLGNITVSNDRYVLGSVTLTVVNGFTGEWHVGGTLDKLVIGEIGASNTATGTYLGTNVTFTHNVSADYLSFTYNNHTYYIFAKIVQNGEAEEAGYELIISTSEDMLQGLNVYCLGTSAETDGYRGTYTAADGRYIVFDGLSGLTYGNGTAIIYDANGNVSEVYTYTVNSFGMAYLTSDVNYIAKPVASGADGAYSGNGKSYSLVTPDRLYMRSALGDNDEIYTFDGIDTVICGDKTYSYVINERDELALAYKLTLTDGDGNTYSAEVGYGSTTYAFRFVDELTDITVTVGNISYVFVSAGKLTATDTSEDEPKVVTYTYVINGYNKETKTYSLNVTDGDGVEYLGVLDCSNEDEYTLKLTKNS